MASDKLHLIRETPKRLLAIFAHPDDADIGVGGTLSLFSKAGTLIRLIVACNGDKGTLSESASSVELVAWRKGEVEEASRILGVSEHHMVGIDDGEVENSPALRRMIVGEVRSFKPDVVVTHDPSALFFGTTYFNHRDHRELGMAVLDSVFPAAGSPLYFPDAGSPHQVSYVMMSGTLEANVAIDITSTIDAKRESVRSHQSQVKGDEEYILENLVIGARQVGRRANVTYAEAFRIMANPKAVRS
ncbi:MAG: PIG-L family deacetylase [Actinomycetota bacterium]|nr:PIG-L family deacetylase [Actinomycetota bacterium]